MNRNSEAVMANLFSKEYQSSFIVYSTTSSLIKAIQAHTWFSCVVRDLKEGRLVTEDIREQFYLEGEKLIPGSIYENEVAFCTLLLAMNEVRDPLMLETINFLAVQEVNELSLVIRVARWCMEKLTV